MAGHTLKARWGQPATGIVALLAFFFIAWLIWFIFSDPRGPVASFPYPFVMYLAMMILVGLWQHMFLGDWPFQDLPQPARGLIETVVNLLLVWFVIHVVFYRILGVGFNFFSQVNLEALAAAGKTALPEVCGKTLGLDKAHAGLRRKIVCECAELLYDIFHRVDRFSQLPYVVQRGLDLELAVRRIEAYEEIGHRGPFGGFRHEDIRIPPSRQDLLFQGVGTGIEIEARTPQGAGEASYLRRKSHDSLVGPLELGKGHMRGARVNPHPVDRPVRGEEHLGEEVQIPHLR